MCAENISIDKIKNRKIDEKTRTVYSQASCSTSDTTYTSSVVSCRRSCWSCSPICCNVSASQFLQSYIQLSILTNERTYLIHPSKPYFPFYPILPICKYDNMASANKSTITLLTQKLYFSVFIFCSYIFQFDCLGKNQSLKFVHSATNLSLLS